RPKLANRRVSALAVAGRRHPVAHQLEHFLQYRADVFVVLDDDDAPGASARLRFDGRLVDVLGSLAGGEPHHELASLARAGAARLDGAAVQLDEAAHQRQADAEAPLRTIERLLGLDEEVED